MPQLAVCAYNEIVPGVAVETLGVLAPPAAPAHDLAVPVG
jgi:hypothetical protein